MKKMTIGSNGVTMEQLKKIKTQLKKKGEATVKVRGIEVGFWQHHGYTWTLSQLREHIDCYLAK
jgi:RNA-binding protein YhbY